MQASGGVGLPISLMTPIGYQSGDCGYCKGEDSGASYYALSKKLMPEHYQMLMDRGWRRSGTLCYLPDASRSCCPHYTIRLPASEFQASRDQRQTLYRWNRFVLGDKYIKQASAKQPKSKGEKKRNTNTFDLTTTVHESEESKTIADVDPAPDHAFTVNLEPDTFTEEKYDLFHDYQQHVHHEGPSEISRAGFKRFLCSSPLERRTDPSGKKLGSYHHCYRLDGRLIAMAVLDLLPHAVSGVYFLYHRDFEKWSPGKLSALRETALALEGGYEYYYMGYYIHSCLKMRYKGTYKPQHVLDFESFEWDPLDEKMCRLMDERKWVSMSRQRGATEANAQINQNFSTPTTSDSATTTAAEDGDNSKTSDPDAKTTSNESSSNSKPNSIYPTPSHPIPLDAANSSLSLLELGMPGVLTLSQLHEQIDLDRVKISLGRGGSVHRTTDIVSWHDGEETDAASIKGVIAEFAACLGRDLVEGVVVDFSR